jgi:FkbM family methyltransferase
MIILKTLPKSLFNYFGFDVRRKLPPERPLGWHPDHLRDMGYQPKTIVDVGVGRGTPRLYKAFPNSYYVLVEPLREFESDIQSTLGNYNGCYVSAAAGNKEGTTTIHMLPGWKTMSSVRKPSKIHKEIYQGITDAPYQERKRKVPLVTLDRLLEKYSLQPPFGLKIDTEGFELEVVEGGRIFSEIQSLLLPRSPLSRGWREGIRFLISCVPWMSTAFGSVIFSLKDASKIHRSSTWWMHCFVGNERFY